MVLIYLGSDHAGFKTKESVAKTLSKLNVTYEDEGAYTDKPSDYPFYAHEVAQKVKANDAKGILVCGTGIGMSIAANKIKGVRAALVHTEKDAILSRKHNDANILVLSSDTSTEEIQKIIKSWLSTKFSRAKRHQRRIEALE